MDIRSNIREVEKRIARAAERASRSPADITIVAVTKTVDSWLIQQALEAGIRHFGENMVQEGKSKIGQLSVLQPSPTWHMVGHLQTNKAKAAIELFDMIQSVDSVRLAEELSRHAQHHISILLQVNVSSETSKFGFSTAEIGSAVEKITRLPYVEIRGLMTIAPLVKDPEEVRSVFRQFRLLRDSLGLGHLSMGMTDDFEVAIEEGATMVRIGRAIFGERKE